MKKSLQKVIGDLEFEATRCKLFGKKEHADKILNITIPMIRKLVSEKTSISDTINKIHTGAYRHCRFENDAACYYVYGMEN